MMRDDGRGFFFGLSFRTLCRARQTPAVPTTGRACDGDDDDDGVV